MSAHTSNNKWQLIATTVLSSALLVACGGGGGGSSSSSKDNGSNNNGNNNSTILAGTAAIGAPIVGGTVRAFCIDDSGFVQDATTNAQGKWTAKINNKNSLPCMLQLEYEEVDAIDPDLTYTRKLHTMAKRTGTNNISPLTDMTLILAFNMNPASLFDALPMNVGIPEAIAEINMAATAIHDGAGAGISHRAALVKLLSDNFYAVSTGNPLTSTFNADGTGWDHTLDQLQQLWATEGINYWDVVANWDRFTELANTLILELPIALRDPDDGTGGAQSITLADGEKGVAGTVDGRGYAIVEADAKYVNSKIENRRLIITALTKDSQGKWEINAASPKRGNAGSTGPVKTSRCSTDNVSIKLTQYGDVYETLSPAEIASKGAGYDCDFGAKRADGGTHWVEGMFSGWMKVNGDVNNLVQITNGYLATHIATANIDSSMETLITGESVTYTIAVSGGYMWTDPIAVHMPSQAEFCANSEANEKSFAYMAKKVLGGHNAPKSNVTNCNISANGVATATFDQTTGAAPGTYTITSTFILP